MFNMGDMVPEDLSSADMLLQGLDQESFIQRYISARLVLLSLMEHKLQLLNSSDMEQTSPENPNSWNPDWKHLFGKHLNKDIFIQ